MKKLVMVVSALLCAMSIQAASIDWSVTANSWYLSDGTTKAAKNTVVYLIDGGQWDAIKTAIDSGATSFTTSDSGILAVGQTSNTKGYVDGGTASHSSLTAGTSYDFAYLVFDSSANKYFASATFAQTAYELTDPDFNVEKAVQFDADSFTVASLSGGWQTPVPEPTSGLLLLMGGALLALRRKQK